MRQLVREQTRPPSFIFAKNWITNQSPSQRCNPRKASAIPFYHTNVMMSIGTRFCAICLDSIDDAEERQAVSDELASDGREIIALSESQIEQFAGNMLELEGSNGPVIAMSSSAFHALDSEQIERLKKHGQIIHSDLETIETCGGGSARCMIAEIHLPRA